MMGEHPKPLGVVVGVDGTKCQVGMYNMSNDSEFLWDGELLMGPRVGAFLTILQNDIKIIASVSSEKVMDQQNSVKSKEFDNRYSKNSINRIIELKKQGVIENGHFHLTSRHEPMVGNVVALTTQEELNAIYSVDEGEPTIIIGESVREGKRVELPINKFFASHIGIFGNTGSGKSNTLHKLYLELFKSQYRDEIFKKSRFFVIDFNGEYTSGQFGVSPKSQKIFDINTRNPGEGAPLPIKKECILDPDILAILFDARPATQLPFLRRAIEQYRKISSSEQFARLEIGLLISLFKDYKDIKLSSGLVESWFKIANDLNSDIHRIDGNQSSYELDYGKVNFSIKDQGNQDIPIFSNGKISNQLRIDFYEEKLKTAYSKLDNEIERLRYFLQFQRIFDEAFKSLMPEYINPLFRRIDVALADLKPVVEIVDNIESEFATLNILSLAHANRNIKRLMPMLLAKMIYDEQKEAVANNGGNVCCTKHLIVDEAHNILSASSQSEDDSWQSYRLSVFEEIIKEGRKFGFFLTLASQRPADISPTIISQIHNFFIHRLVNDTDLRMLENTMPTLDRNSYSQISSLGQGEAIVTGTAVQVPILLHVDREEQVTRPNSDDVCLTRDIWSGRDDAMVDDETCNDSAEDIAWDFPHDEYSNDQFDGGRGWAASENW